MHLNYFYKKIRVGSGRVNYLTRPGIFGLGQSGTRIIGSKFGALGKIEKFIKKEQINLMQQTTIDQYFE